MSKRLNSRTEAVPGNEPISEPAALHKITTHREFFIWLMERLDNEGPPVRVSRDVGAICSDLIEQVATGRITQPVQLTKAVIAESAWDTMEGGEPSYLCGKRKLDFLGFVASLTRKPGPLGLRDMNDSAISCWKDQKHFLKFRYNAKKGTTRVSATGECRHTYRTKIDVEFDGLPWCCSTEENAF